MKEGYVRQSYLHEIKFHFYDSHKGPNEASAPHYKHNHHTTTTTPTLQPDQFSTPQLYNQASFFPNTIIEKTNVSTNICCTESVSFSFSLMNRLQSEGCQGNLHLYDYVFQKFLLHLSEIRNKESEIVNHKSEVIHSKSEIIQTDSRIRNQKSEFRHDNQKS